MSNSVPIFNCLRCGYCCVAYDVILPDGTYKKGGTICPNLSFNEEGACCSIHGQKLALIYNGKKHYHSWKNTPCGQHGQIGDGDCRMGKYLLDKGEDGRDFIKEGI